MRPAVVPLILVSILLSSGSQVMLKLGMSSAVVRTALADGSRSLSTVVAVCSSYPVLAGMLCFGLSAVVWLFVLARIPLSTAYPFVALGIALTVVAGHVVFGEVISVTKLLGVGLILLGIAVVAVAP